MKKQELPAGVMRASFGKKVVMLVDSQLPFSLNDEMLKLADTMGPKERNMRYWLFSVSKGDFKKDKKNLEIRVSDPKSMGFETYDEAEENYAVWAKNDNNDKVKVRGLGIEAMKKLE